MKNLSISSLMLLVILTFTVIAYDFQYYNIPSSMYLNAYSLAPKKGTEFRLTLPSVGIPHEHRNVTEDIEFRTEVLDYVIASDTVRYPIQIPEHSSAEWWLKHASNFSQYDMTVEFFNESYFLQVRYYKDFHRTTSETIAFYTINITTIIAWICFTILSLRIPLKKWRMKNEENNNFYLTYNSATSPD